MVFCITALAAFGLVSPQTFAATSERSSVRTAPPEPGAPVDGPRFDVFEFEVEGNTKLAPIAIEKAVYPFLGSAKTLNDIEAARASLEKVYHDAGYLTVMVDIPEQKVDHGTVRLKVVEGAVDRLRITGSRYYSHGVIRSQIPELAEGNVPDFKAVQKQLAELNRGSDRTVTPVLRPGQTPGKVDVDLKVKDEFPLHGGIELNNRQSPDTTALRLNGYLRYDNLWQRQHSVALNYQISPQDVSEVRALSGTYVMPFESGNSLALYGIKSDSNVATLGSIDVVGKGAIAGVRYIAPLRPLGQYTHSATLGLDYKDFQQSTQLDTGAIQTPVRYVSSTLQYSAARLDSKGRLQFDASATMGLRGLSEREVECLPGDFEDQFECSRHGAKASFFYAKADVTRMQTLPKDMTLVLKLQGQVSRDPLISNEQFYAGGAETVRGYLESEVLGDSGFIASAEVRSPSFAAVAHGVLDQLFALLFVDAARLYLVDALPGQQARFSLSSAGVGLRATAPHGLSAALDLAVALEEGARTKAGDTRIHFKVAYEF